MHKSIIQECIVFYTLLITFLSLCFQLGFNGNFFWRFDYNDKQIRLNESTMELIWRGSNSLKSPSADIFTSILYNGYGPPKGFCFDEKCHDEPIKVL